MSALLLVTLSILSTADTPEVTSLIEQLTSIEQTERDAAANRLREIFKPAPRKDWEPLLAKLRPGISKKELKELLEPEQREPGIGIGTGQSHMEEYRLDHTWYLRCWFLNEGDVLRESTLEERTRHIWIAPPADFTGTWVVYYANGQPSHEIEYRSGKYHGTFTANYSTGKKSYIQHYGPNGADGEDIGYHPSGKIAYRGQYSKGKPTGVWTHYNEQGEVTSTQVH
jgi:hypothetical protein